MVSGCQIGWDVSVWKASPRGLFQIGNQSDLEHLYPVLASREHSFFPSGIPLIFQEKTAVSAGNCRLLAPAEPEVVLGVHLRFAAVSEPAGSAGPRGDLSPVQSADERAARKNFY